MSNKRVWPGMREALQAMVPRIEGKPCVYLTRYTKQIFICRGITDIRVEEDCLCGRNDWVDPPEARLDDLNDEFMLSYDVLEFGPDCWYDRYFQAWFVFDSAMVTRSLQGDHSWVGPYLGLDKTPYPDWDGKNPFRPPGSQVS